MFSYLRSLDYWNVCFSIGLTAFMILQPEKPWIFRIKGGKQKGELKRKKEKNLRRERAAEKDKMSKNQFILANQQQEKQIISSTGWTLPSANSADYYGVQII